MPTCTQCKGNFTGEWDHDYVPTVGWFCSVECADDFNARLKAGYHHRLRQGDEERYAEMKADREAKRRSICLRIRSGC